jgi:hypothetical protein
VPDSHIDDPKHWFERTKEAHAIPHENERLDAKQTMLGIARDYFRLAIRAEVRAKDLPIKLSHYSPSTLLDRTTRVPDSRMREPARRGFGD